MSLAIIQDGVNVFPGPEFYFSVSKNLNVEYQNGNRTRAILVSVKSTVTVNGGEGSLYLCRKISSGVTGADVAQFVGIANGTAAEEKMFFAELVVPPKWFYKLIAVQTNATVQLFGSWDEVDF